MRYRVLASVVLAGAIVAGCKTTQQAEPEMKPQSEMQPMAEPEMRPVGTVYHGLRDGEADVLRLVSRDSEALIYEKPDGCRFQRSVEHGSFFSPTVKWENCGGSTGGRNIESVSGEPWPLEVGKTWSYDAEGWTGGDRWTSDTRCSVDGTARVKVPMGEFDTYKVICNTKWTQKVRYVAPDVGTTVKLVQSRNSAYSNAPEYTWVLERMEEPATS